MPAFVLPAFSVLLLARTFFELLLVLAFSVLLLVPASSALLLVAVVSVAQALLGFPSMMPPLCFCLYPSPLQLNFDSLQELSSHPEPQTPADFVVQSRSLRQMKSLFLRLSLRVDELHRAAHQAVVCVGSKFPHFLLSCL